MAGGIQHYDPSVVWLVCCQSCSAVDRECSLPFQVDVVAAEVQVDDRRPWPSGWLVIDDTLGDEVEIASPYTGRTVATPLNLPVEQSGIEVGQRVVVGAVDRDGNDCQVLVNGVHADTLDNGTGSRVSGQESAADTDLMVSCRNAAIRGLAMLAGPDSKSLIISWRMPIPAGEIPVQHGDRGIVDHEVGPIVVMSENRVDGPRCGVVNPGCDGREVALGDDVLFEQKVQYSRIIGSRLADAEVDLQPIGQEFRPGRVATDDRSGPVDGEHPQASGRDLIGRADLGSELFEPTDLLIFEIGVVVADMPWVRSITAYGRGSWFRLCPVRPYRRKANERWSFSASCPVKAPCYVIDRRA